MNEYQENLLDHYSHPRNYGIPNFKSNSASKLQNLSCGDELEIFFNIQNGIVKNISFIGEGCSIAIGAASILCEEILGKSVNELSDYGYENLEKLIGLNLTTSRRKCAHLSLETLKNAISQYMKSL